MLLQSNFNCFELNRNVWTDDEMNWARITSKEEAHGNSENWQPYHVSHIIVNAILVYDAIDCPGGRNRRNGWWTWFLPVSPSLSCELTLAPAFTKAWHASALPVGTCDRQFDKDDIWHDYVKARPKKRRLGQMMRPILKWQLSNELHCKWSWIVHIEHRQYN